MYPALKLNKQGDNIQLRCTPFPIWKVGLQTQDKHQDKQVDKGGLFILFSSSLLWEGGREESSGWGTRVYLWRIHVDIWQNQYNIVKLKKKKSLLSTPTKENALAVIAVDMEGKNTWE